MQTDSEGQTCIGVSYNNTAECARKELAHSKAVEETGGMEVLLPPEEGAGTAEYALILVLVVIIVFALLMILGSQIGNTFSSVSSNLESLPQ